MQFRVGSKWFDIGPGHELDRVVFRFNSSGDIKFAQFFDEYDKMWQVNDDGTQIGVMPVGVYDDHEEGE